MTKFIMMCGLPASGKSDYSKELAKKYHANIHASDAIRKELSGGVNNQYINKQVFETLHNRVKEDLKQGKNCIYDATNISYKRRMNFLSEIHNIPCKKICVLMATPIGTCFYNNSKRSRQLPMEVIERMYINFDVPYYYEGWDKIKIKYFKNSKGSYGKPISWVKSVIDFEQDNPHHSLTLGNHCLETYKCVKHSPCYSKNLSSKLKMTNAALLHDCGKPKVKSFVDSRGFPSVQAHYYKHDRVGAYDSLFYSFACSHLDVAILIRWHMQPYCWKYETTEQRYKLLWGDYLYNSIIKLHMSDENEKGI